MLLARRAPFSTALEKPIPPMPSYLRCMHIHASSRGEGGLSSDRRGDRIVGINNRPAGCVFNNSPPLCGPWVVGGGPWGFPPKGHNKRKAEPFMKDQSLCYTIACAILAQGHAACTQFILRFVLDLAGAPQVGYIGDPRRFFGRLLPDQAFFIWRHSGHPSGPAGKATFLASIGRYT